MNLNKLGVVLLALLLAGMAMVPCVSAASGLTKEEILKKVSTANYVPSKEFTIYMNAPSITEQQKNDAVMIASASKLSDSASAYSVTTDQRKKFGDYIQNTHGSINFHWAYPYSGDIYLSTTIGSPESAEYGLAYAIVDVNDGTVLSEGFTNLHKYW